MIKFSNNGTVLGELDVSSKALLNLLGRVAEDSRNRGLNFHRVFNYLLGQSLVLSSKYGRFMVWEVGSVRNYSSADFLVLADGDAVIVFPEDFIVRLEIYNGTGNYVYNSDDKIYRNFIKLLVLETLVEYPELTVLLEDAGVGEDGVAFRFISDASISKVLSYVDWGYIERFFRRELNKLDKVSVRLVE